MTPTETLTKAAADLAGRLDAAPDSDSAIQLSRELREVMIALHEVQGANLLTINEAAEALHTSRSTIYRMIASKDLKAARIRRRGLRSSSGRTLMRIPLDEIKRIAKAAS